MPSSSSTPSLASLPLHRQLRDGRRALGLTQADLARQVGCQQSAISMLEGGRTDAVGRPTLEKIAGLLGVELAPEGAATAAAPRVAPTAGHRHCPSGACPSNVPFAIAGELVFWPRAQPAGFGRHCAYCGEVLASTCRRCGSPATAGACCRDCGTPWIDPPEEALRHAESWAESRRKAIAEWRSLTE